MDHDAKHYIRLSQAYATQALTSAYNPYVDYNPEVVQAHARAAITLAFIASGYCYNAELKEWIQLYERHLGALLGISDVASAIPWSPIRLQTL